jgi:signal transduction histidine kinase
MVYTANNDKVWGEIPYELTIIITPPFWATSYAIIIYIILSIAIFIYILKRYQRRTQKKILKEKEIYEQEQKIKLDLMKFQFFTNISHEFRTPLTLILTPSSITTTSLDEELVRKALNFVEENIDNPEVFYPFKHSAVNHNANSAKSYAYRNENRERFDSLAQAMNSYQLELFR